MNWKQEIVIKGMFDDSTMTLEELYVEFIKRYEKEKDDGVTVQEDIGI
jgi:hypothetical protein